MATSAFKSTTKRPSLAPGCTASTTQFSPETHTDYNKNVPRGKFVNTTRGSGEPFPEISLDDLALEFFSSSSNNDNVSDGVLERKGRPGRSASRLGEVGRWATDTASSRRRARSVSKSRAGEGSVSSSSTSGGKTVSSNEAGSRRRRSMSVARYQISDSESEVDSFRNSNKHAPARCDSRNASGQKTTALSNRRLGRSRSHKNLLHDGYSSEYPSVNATNGGLYEAMRKEIRYAVEEICTELNQTMGRDQTALASDLQSENSDVLQNSSGIKEKYASKLEQSEKCKQDILTESTLEEQQGQEVFKVLQEHCNSRTSAIADKSSRARKRSSDRSRISENLIEEAERIFEDFICNVEDADISSFDGDRSDGSSTLGGTMKTRNSATMEAEHYMTPPVEMDGVTLPWLQWETSHDGFLSGKNKAHTPVTPKVIPWDLEKDMPPCNDQGGYSISSHGSWSPSPSQDIFESPPKGIKHDDIFKSSPTCIKQDNSLSCFDMGEYRRLQSNEDTLSEMYRQQNRISSGGLLLCTHALY